MKTPRTDAVVRMAVGPMREYAIIEHAQNLERELIAEHSRRVMAETTVTACHSAMLGKVNPKHPAWGCVYAVQDDARKADSPTQ